MANLKKCDICEVEKSHENFHKDGRTRDGIRAICIDCEIKQKNPGGLKKCSRCGNYKSLQDFRKDRRLPDGVRTDCRSCESARKKMSYDANADQHREHKRKFYLENRDKRNSYNRQYCRQNTDSLCEYQREYREKNVDKLKIQRRVRYLANPDVYKARANIRRVRVMAQEHHFTAEQWRALCAYYGYTCLRCGKREPEILLSPDHVIPIARGGSNSIHNIQPLCRVCNKKKYAKTGDYRVNFEGFLKQIGLLE